MASPGLAAHHLPGHAGATKHSRRASLASLRDRSPSGMATASGFAAAEELEIPGTQTTTGSHSAYAETKAQTDRQVPWSLGHGFGLGAGPDLSLWPVVSSWRPRPQCWPQKPPPVASCTSRSAFWASWSWLNVSQESVLCQVQ